MDNKENEFEEDIEVTNEPNDIDEFDDTNTVEENFDEVYGFSPSENADSFESDFIEPNQPVVLSKQYQPLLEKKRRKKVRTSAKVFMIILLVITQISVISLVAITALSVKDMYSSQPDSDSGGNSDNSDESDDSDDESADAYLPTTPDDQPDIEYESYTEGITLVSSEDKEVLTAEEVYEKVIESTVTIFVSIEVNGVVSEGYGSGVIITSDGFILTNSHVVSDTKACTVTIITCDGEEYPAVVVGLDKGTDIAILKTEDHDFTPAEFGDSEELSMAETVLAIGSPSGVEFAGSVTSGIVSGLHRYVDEETQEIMTYIQTDTAINPGNSGGPLVNMYGQVIGINVFKIVGDSYEGMGFAIPITDAKDIIDQLLEKGYVDDRVRLGITAISVEDYISGVLIYTISEDSCFVETDVEVGDVIVGMDGYVITSLDDLSNLLLLYDPGDEVVIDIYRYDDSGGQEFSVTVTLIADEGETQG